MRLYPNGIPSYQMALTRILADGSSADQSFGTNGIGLSAFPYASSSPRPNDLALAPGGNIVVTGIGSTYGRFATARFLGDPTTPAVQPTHASAPPTTALTATDPTLVPLALNDTSFVASLLTTKSRKTRWMTG